MLVIIVAVAVACLLLPVAGWTLAGWLLAVKAFSQRLEGPGAERSAFLSIAAEHPGWQRRPVSFQGPQLPGSCGGVLRGFLMDYADTEPRALLVLFHGYGLSLEDYLPECEYFCRRGYRVLAFDGTGTGYSDGVLYGLPLHVEDLRCCLDYVGADPELSRLPLLLYGHSWGGYACDTVSALGAWPIRGIISASGFATAEAALVAHTKRHYGIFAPLGMLGVRLYQKLCFGPVAKLGAVEGLAAAACPVLIAQSDDDPIITFRDNYGVLQRRFADDPKKTFLPLTGQGHNITVPREADRRKRRLMQEIRKAPQDQTLLAEFYALQKETDTALLQRFGDFLDACLSKGQVP